MIWKNQLSDLEDRIRNLESIVHESEIRRKIDAATKYINQEIVEIIKNLDAEHPDNPVEFIIKDLTLKVKNASGRDDYLWEIGSASNWLAYHIATILAFQQFFQTRGSVAVPNFVYFHDSQAKFIFLSALATALCQKKMYKLLTRTSKLFRRFLLRWINFFMIRKRMSRLL